MPFTYDAHFVL